MKKVFKIVGRVLAALLLLVAVALVVVAYKGGDIAKSYIEEHDKELLGREVSVDNIDISLLHSAVCIDGVKVFEQDEKTKFLSFDSLFVDINLFDLLSKEVNLQHVHLRGIDVKVLQRDSVFNFSDIIEHFSQPDTVAVADTTPSSWAVGIYDIRLRHCKALYNDKVLNSKFELNDVNIDVPGIYFSNKPTDVDLNLNFENGGSLKAKMSYDMESSRFQINTSIRNFSIACVKPYMRQGVRVGDVSGLLDVDATMKGDFNHIMNFTISGKSSLKNVKVTDDLGRLVLSANRTSAELVRLNLTDNEIHLGTVDGDGIGSQFIVDKAGDNISYFVNSPEAAERREERDSIAQTLPDSVKQAVVDKNPLKFIIDKVDMRNMTMHMEDASQSETFVYDVKDFCVKAENVTLDKPNDVFVSGRLGKTGSMEGRWRGDMYDMANQNLTLTLNNVDLTEFNPYFHPLFAYRIVGGNMSVVSQNVITNNELKGVNKLSVMGCSVEKDKQVENAEFKVPLKTALYVITDKNGKISIDLPVTGNIDSPEFNYKKIITKTLLDFLAKVGSAPVKSFAKLFGGAGNVEEVPFGASSSSLSVEIYNQLNGVVALVKEKPELKLSLTQQINYADAIEESALNQLKTDYFLSLHPDKNVQNLELVDKDDIEKLDVKSVEFKAYFTEKDSTKSFKSAQKYAISKYGAMAPSVVSASAQARSEQIQTYLKQQLDSLAQNVQVITEPYDSTKSYSGKTVLKLDVLGE